MSEKNDGGPAFPGHGRYTEHGDYQPVTHIAGMSLRDWFAGQVVAGHVASTQYPEKLAKWAYDIADAMLKARER